MDGFKAFKYYTAIKLHFSSPKFDVFKNRGHVRGSYSTFLNRNDHVLFERLARQLDDKQFIQYCASNFMYGNKDVVYHTTEAMSNYKEYIRRKQSITRVFTEDLNTIVNSGATYDFSGQKIPDVVQLYLAGKITVETMAILDKLDGIVDNLKQKPHVALLLGDELLKIEKSKGFVKFDPYKVMDPYQQFLEEVQR